MEVRRILCPVDFSPASRSALDVAADFARRFGAELTLLHVFHVPGYTLPEGVVLPSAEVIADLFERIDRGLGEWRQIAEAAGAPKVETVSVEGVPWHEIVERTRTGRFDLAVVGTHGHSGLRHVFLGSVAEKVVRHAACPVLTIRTPEA